MAYAAVISLVQTLKQVLDTQEILFSKEQIECLLAKVSFLQVFLEDFSDKSIKDVKYLEGQIRDAAYAAEAIIDSYISNQLLLMCDCCIDRDYTIFCQELQDVIEKVDSVKSKVGEWRDMGSRYLERNNFLSANSLRLASGGKNSMVGFVDELVQIKDRLTGEPSYKLDIVSIVGMGGSGKTTLARNIYEDAYVVYHFYIHAWITVTQEYDVRAILLGILESMKKVTVENCQASTDQLGDYLYKSLKGNRYLLVFDDMWEVAFWDEIKLFFPDDGNGSRIMLTSRILDVALYASPNNPPYQMRFLYKDESWNLLKEKVFEDQSCPPELEGVGIEIAQSCQGLPLTILLVGGLLGKVPRSQDQWRNVAENVKSIIAAEYDKCLEILSLSYNHLPHHLKMCFLYMGVFPEDYQIPVSKLVWLWAAEGFLKEYSDESLQEVGEKYLKDLIDRSMVLVGKTKSSSKIKTCVIHDVVRDLCLREAQKEKFLHTLKCVDDLSSEGTSSHHRLNFHSNLLEDDASFCRCSMVVVREHSDGRLKEIYDAMKSSPLIRSLIFTGTYQKPMNIYLGFRLLRVLDAVRITFVWFPMEVIQLANLRYLALTFDGEVPASVSNLRKLKFLIVNQIFWQPVFYLSSEIWGMPQLLHLKFKGIYFPDTHFYEEKISCLENLQTLSGIRDFRVTENVFKSIPNVKKLGIMYDKNSKTDEWSLYCLHNLVNLHQLETLKCHFHSTSSLQPDLPDLTFPSRLKKLSLCGWEIPSTHMTIIGSLHNLEIFKLHSCSYQDPEWELVEGEFCRLKVLLLENTNLMRWRADFDHFPNLERLIIKYCHDLEEIPLCFRDIPTLELIKLLNCSTSCEDSAKQILENQQSLGNDDLKVIIRYKNKPSLPDFPY